MGAAFFFKQIGNFEHLNHFLETMLKGDLYGRLDSYAQQGVSALSNATPRDSGITAESWDYVISVKGGTSSITWTNSHYDDDSQTPVVILLEFGHGTGTGGYVAGYDFINPAISGVMDDIANSVWKAVVGS